jgi:hypothetical protein
MFIKESTTKSLAYDQRQTVTQRLRRRSDELVSTDRVVFHCLHIHIYIYRQIGTGDWRNE